MSEYQVLARKYRPGSLEDLIGQDVLVRTLTNAINNQRIPHAFIMTGIRGVGKTSTARIIARSLVCVGKDGKNDKPTTTPCGQCEQCVAIAQDRHVDVLEMDAASHTGVADIREIIENVHYHPVMARYKVYVIDEVHMLSKSAFNALLKTLEEPPEHAKFIFATTEIRKIPVTILSRCMRFDLARIDIAQMSEHLKKIAKKEKVKIGDEALSLISNMSEGSVRDGLSLLDQAIGIADKGKKIDRILVSAMLGIADKGKLFELFGNIVQGQPQEAINHVRDMYQAGGDPIVILHDLLDLTHLITQMKVIPEMEKVDYIAENDRKSAREFADKLSMSFLARLWQMLLKGIDETKLSHNSLMAAEMIIIRIAYCSDAPTPDDLLKKYKLSKDVNNANVANQKEGAEQSSTEHSMKGENNLKLVKTVNMGKSSQQFDNEVVEVGNQQTFSSFEEFVELFASKKEHLIYGYLQDISLIEFNSTKRKFEFSPASSTPPNFAGQVVTLLKTWTGENWLVSISSKKGNTSLRESKENIIALNKEKTCNDDVVLSILKYFPDAVIEDIKLL